MEYEFINTFPTHLFIEMVYNHEDRKGLIDEELTSYNDFKILCEEYGLFPDCDWIANQIFLFVEKAVRYNKSFIKLCFEKSTFIDEVDVIINYNVDAGFKYSMSKSEFGDDGKFKPLSIEVPAKSIIAKNCTSEIMHELTHACEDYCRKNNHTDSISDIYNKVGYEKYIKEKDKKSPKSKLDVMVSNILYYLTSFERNAFIAELSGELQS
jgi:hypothetical protein